MKKARIPILVQDPITGNQQKIIEGFDAQRKFFLDGPVTDRVAVLDFDPASDELIQGAHFNKGKKLGWFEDEKGRNVREYTDEDIYSPTFIQTSTFATVLKTLDLFDEQRGMGRPLTWAFNSPQLLVIPRAGEMANAYYQRDSHSLQFFFFPSEKKAGKIIYACLSRDIVAHETGHAIIDGIAPHLMDSASPQSLAIHEALADIIGHQDADKARLTCERDYARIGSYLAALNLDRDPYVKTLLDINNPRCSSENVVYLRKLAKHTYFVCRETDLEKKHPFVETKFEIWAPEENTADYYSGYLSPALGMTEAEESGGKIALRDYEPPAGVDANVFYDLIEARRQYTESLLAIDKAENNTSVVCCIEWRGWRLLFTGDAELKSWKFMQDKGKLKPVDFLKVSHHCSHNGTPGEDTLEAILPKRTKKGKERYAAVSTWHDTYSGVPDPATFKRIYDPAISTLQPRCDRLVMVNESIADKLYEDFFFNG